MKALKIIAIIVLALGALLFGAALLSPKKVPVERSLTIAASPEQLYADVGYPASWPAWTVWNKELDPTLTHEVSGPEHGVGAIWKFKSKREGSGTLRIVEASPQAGIRYELAFEGMEVATTGGIRFTPGPAGTQVTWTDELDLSGTVLPRVAGSAIAKLLGAQLEQNLAKLKARAEQRAAGAATGTP